MKIFGNNGKRKKDGYASFEYRGCFVLFEDTVFAYVNYDGVHSINKSSGLVVYNTVEEAIQAINKLELKLAEA